MINTFVGWGGKAGRQIAVDLNGFLDNSRGIRSFVARDITPGLQELPEIVEAIQGSDVMVMVVTSGTFRSKRWKDELGYGYRRGIPTLPFVANGAPIPALLEYIDAQRLRFDPSNPSHEYSKVLQAVRLLVKIRRSP
jgi:hypothetical protein